MNTKYKMPILLIEDNAGDTELIRLYLEDASLKHHLITVETLYEGLEILQTQEVALTLLDLSLPDISGFKTLTRYLNEISKVPVIVMTGMNNEIIGNQAIKAGAQDFLVKGQFDGKLLGRAIRYATQRFKTQLKLEEVAHSLAISESRYSEAQEMAKFGNWEVDIVSNKMKWTKEVFRIFGFPPNSLSPSLSDYFEYVHLEDRELVESFFEKASKDGKLHTLEHRILVDGISIRYVALQAKVHFDELTQKILLLGGIQDITERKVSEKLIVERNLTNQTSKIKDEVLSEMSFHIRTPLSSIVNLVYLLEKSIANSQQKELIDGLKTSTDDLSIMINNLLNFSVLVSEEIKVEEEEFNIKELFQSVEKVIQIKADNTEQLLEFDTEANLPEKVISDPQKLMQIFYNLIDNALKYSKSDGITRIEILSTAVQVNTLNLYIRVHADGDVMTPNEIEELLNAEKLLEVYTEEKGMPKKQELGIAIVSKLIKAMQGTLQINSQEELGSVFEVQLPIKLRPKQNLRHADKPESPLRILLVEDHFLNQIATKKVLTTWSDLVSVDIAENGLIGYQKFREHGYDLVLMDLQMPIMNGLDSAQRIRSGSNAPIIALTANASKQEQSRAFEVGMNDYLSKPFKPEDLYSKIMEVLSEVQIQAVN